MSENTQLDLLWNKITERLKQIVTPISYNAFFENLTPQDILNKKIVVAAEADFTADVIMSRFADKLREAIVSSNVGLNDFILVVEGSSHYTLDEEPDALIEAPPVVLDKKFTFDSFVQGTSNKFVFAAAKSVAEAPGENFNPLYIYGGTGLGKTHLLQAIANNIADKRPALKVIYTTSETFLNEYVDSIARKGSGRDNEQRFRNRYRNVDVLLIDDIQFWAGKRGVQEVFFHTFNELFAQHKQIVISSDCPAKDLTTLEERLRTRFEGGLIADIQPPDIETKIAILKRKALEKKCVIPDDVLAFLVKNSDNNVRTLEGRLNTVIFASKLHEEPISVKLAAVALRESVDGSDPQEEVTPDTIIHATCSHFSVTEAELIGKSKRQEIVRARQVCIYLMCDMLALPLISVGKIMGGRDHSTVIYARDKISELMRMSDSVIKDVTDIKSAILKE